MNCMAFQFRLQWGSASDQGMLRDENEDAVYADNGLFIVADGVGGHTGGSVASRMAIETLVAASPSSSEELRAAAYHANEVLLRYPLENDDNVWLTDMCTTLCAIAVDVSTNSAPCCSVVNVGDSRAYRYRRKTNGGELVQLTVDHNVATERVAEGRMTPGEAKIHPLRHQLTSVVGFEPDTKIDDWVLGLEANDRLLLCTDGLTEEVDDQEITEILSTGDHPSDIAETLVDTANAHGGSDNVTALVVDILPAASPESGS